MNNRVFVIAEAGVNHNGALESALALVDAAADAGADAVKFQTFEAAKLASRSAAKADYQNRTTDAGESQYEMLRRLELPRAWHADLKERAEAKGLVFLSTPFDPESLAFLVEELDVAIVKLGSGELTNAPLLFEAGRSGKPVILSTGMGEMAEVEAALGVLAAGRLGLEAGRETFARAFASAEGKASLAEAVTLLHCVTEYPAPLEEVNLRAMDALAESFGLPVGYSDHSRGTAISIAAAGRGARVIEKHYTLDRTLPGPDHLASLEPAELKQMILAIRQIEPALGDGRKRAMPSEAKNLPIARKSLVAARRIARGETFTPDNLTVKRPGNGRSPFDYWSLLGTAAERDYAEDEVIR